MATSRPPPAPAKARPLPPTRAPTATATRRTRAAAAAADDNVDALAKDLTKLAVRPTARAKPSELPKSAAARPRVTPSTKPLGHSTAQNRVASTASQAPTTTASRRVASGTVKSASAELVPAPPSPTERAQAAMKAVNTALATLTTLNKAGYRALATLPTTASRASSTTTRPGSAASSARSSSLVRGAASDNTTVSSSRPTATATAAQASNRDKVERAAKEAARALFDLRSLVHEGTLARKRVDVEKAAVGIIANLVEMELYTAALQEIAAARTSLLSWWRPGVAPERAPVATRPLNQHAANLIVPLPLPVYLEPPSLAETLNSSNARPALADFAPLVLTLQQYLLACLFRCPTFACRERTGELAHVVRQLEGEGGPLAWRNLMGERDLGEVMPPDSTEDAAEAERRIFLRKKVDASLTSMFGIVTKGCAGADTEADAQDLLDVRIHALELYATTSALVPGALDKLSAFFDQVRKTLLLYGRSAEKAASSPVKISEAVRGAFDRILEALEKRGLLGQEAKSSERWRELCEVVLHIARRADDLDTVERIAQLTGTGSLDEPGSAAASNPDTQASQLVAKVANALAVFEIWLKTNEDRAVADQLRRTTSILPALTRLRCPDPASGHVELSTDSTTRLDKTLDRLRYVLVKRIKGAKRMDQLVTQSGNAAPNLSEIDSVGRTLLDRLMAHVERVLGSVPAGKARIQLATTAIDSLLVLAHVTVVVDDRATHTQALALLGRAECIIRDSPSTAPKQEKDDKHLLDLDMHYSIRALSSAYYNLGGMLYNAGVPENALAFAQRACDLGDAALESARTRDRIESRPSELVESMGALAIKDGESESPSSKDEERKQERDAVTDLERLMSRRWNLLALTQRALGDKRASYQASLASVLAQPKALFCSIAEASARKPISQLAQSQPALLNAITRLTRLGTFDLLLPPKSIPLSQAARAASLDGPVLGSMLEMQALALQPYIDTEDGRQAAVAVVCETVEVYERHGLPLRKARMLVEKLRLVGPSATVETAEAILAEVGTLCEQANLHDDAGLRGFATQYRALAHLRMVEVLQAAHSTVADIDVKIAEHAKAALALLSDLVPPAAPASQSLLRLSTSSTAARPSATHASPQSPQTATRSRRPVRAGPTPARVRASTRRAATTERDQKTPPKKLAVERDVLRESVRGQQGGAATGHDAHESTLMDDPESLVTSLSSLAALLGVKGQVALRLRYLQLIQRLSTLPLLETDSAVSATATIALAREYLALGQLSRAGIALAHVQKSIEDGGALASTELRIDHCLTFAEYQAHLGNYERSTQAYEQAVAAAESIDSEQTAGSTTAKILSRTLLLQRASRAANACSTLLQRRGELSSCLGPALQSMRLASRAVQNITRISPKPSSRRGDGEVFTAPAADKNAPLADAAPESPRPSRASFASDSHSSLYWTLAQDLVVQTLRVAHLHYVRGTPKSADFFAQQAYDLAEDLGSLGSMAKALVSRAETAQRWGRTDSVTDHLNRLKTEFSTLEGPTRGAILQVLAEAALACRENDRADVLFAQAQDALDDFGAEVDNESHGAAAAASPPQPRRTSGLAVHFAPFTPSPTNAASSPPTAEWILPSLRSQLIRQRVRLLFRQNKADEGRRLLRRLRRVTSSEEDKAEELKLLAALQSNDLVARCASDPVLGMLPDSVLSMPAFGVSASGSAAKIGTPRTGPSALNAIKDIESLLSRALSLGASRSAADKLSELSIVSAAMRAMQANVSKGSRQLAILVAHGLDLGVAVTLRREVMDAIAARMARTLRLDDLTWPSPAIPTADIASPPEFVLQEKIRDRYRFETAEPVLTETRISEVLPTPWSVVTMCLSAEQDALLVSRQRSGGEAIVFKLPLERLSRREGDEDLSLPYSIAISTLRDIIERSNAGTQNAKYVDSRDARSAWWQERKELDAELQALLEGIEDVWLGAFKSILCDAREHGSDAFAAFKVRIERVLKRSMARAAGDRRTARFKVDDAVLECLAALPATSREEDLEDLFYFMAESFQFSGVPLACDETDVDQVVVDFREALEELHGTKSAPKLRRHRDEHTFLILDKHLHAFPWESLPCLRGRSVSRLPSLSFLRDRLDLAAAHGAQDFLSVSVDPSRTSYILNPGGDLRHTQQTFEPWLKEQSEARGWTGVVARVPMEEEVRNALTSPELFLYFGHGGAEQYIRSQTVRNAPRCAVTMLWGCSSGMLKDQGVFDPTGTPYHYMVGGCPALVANLWDVTDKDIDKFAWSVFRRTGIAAPETTASASPSPVSLTAAVAQSRDVCTLRYLNGAAPVVYGIPLHFKYPASPPSSPVVA